MPIRVVEGRVGIFIGLNNGRMLRVRSLGRRTTTGEMGLITGQSRSATIRAEVASVLYRLPVAAHRDIVLQDPALGQALLKFVVEIMAERLSFANRAIGVLQR